jgi:hypothetical protein
LRKLPLLSARARVSSKRTGMWGVIAQVDTAGMRPAFAGGTSLAKGDCGYRTHISAFNHY